MDQSVKLPENDEMEKICTENYNQLFVTYLIIAVIPFSFRNSVMGVLMEKETMHCLSRISFISFIITESIVQVKG